MITAEQLARDRGKPAAVVVIMETPGMARLARRPALEGLAFVGQRVYRDDTWDIMRMGAERLVAVCKVPGLRTVRDLRLRHVVPLAELGGLVRTLLLRQPRLADTRIYAHYWPAAHAHELHFFIHADGVPDEPGGVAYHYVDVLVRLLQTPRHFETASLRAQLPAPGAPGAPGAYGSGSWPALFAREAPPVRRGSSLLAPPVVARRHSV